MLECTVLVRERTHVHYSNSSRYISGIYRNQYNTNRLWRFEDLWREGATCNQRDSTKVHHLEGVNTGVPPPPCHQRAEIAVGDSEFVLANGTGRIATEFGQMHLQLTTQLTTTTTTVVTTTHDHPCLVGTKRLSDHLQANVYGKV